jgi:hypothetical protein
MDALGVKRGGFVCPRRPTATSQYLGKTMEGKELSIIRFDMAANDMDAEADRFAQNVEWLVDGRYAYS